MKGNYYDQHLSRNSANRGLGRNTAISIARLGGDVIITYRGDDVQAREVVAEIEALGRRAIALQLDIAERQLPRLCGTLRAALLQTWDRDTFDHLINNAGHGEFAMIGETTESQFDGLFDVHVKGVLLPRTDSFASYRRWGRIVNFSSGLTRSLIQVFLHMPPRKERFEILTVYMARELGSRGITVNTVAPGAIETDFGGGLVRDNADVNAQFAGMTALGRVGVPDDIRPMVAAC